MSRVTASISRRLAMTLLDDDLLAALSAARPALGYEPSATSPEAQAMLARVLRSRQDPAGRHNVARLRRWRRTLEAGRQARPRGATVVIRQGDRRHRPITLPPPAHPPAPPLPNQPNP